MSKKRIKILVSSIIIISIIIIAGITIISRKQDSRVKKVNSKDSIENDDIKYLKDDGRTLKVEGNTITLEKYFYDEEINGGYFLISIKQEGKEGKDIFNGWYGPSPLFGGNGYEDSYYYIDYRIDARPGRLGIGGHRIKKTGYEGEKKYIYCVMDMIWPPDEFMDTLVLKDMRIENPAKDPNSLGIGSFKLEDNATWRKFTNGDDIVEVNNYSVRINSGKEKNISDFTIYMKNGDKHTIKENDMREITYDYAYDTTRLRFNEGIDIDKIDYIMWKGEKLKE